MEPADSQCLVHSPRLTVIFKIFSDFTDCLLAFRFCLAGKQPDKKFFTTSEAASLTNHNMGFMYMGGCDFSVPDIRARGLGESIVLDADRGMVGAIVSTRTAWSNQNYDLGKRIVTGWLAPENTDISPTIGEIYAYAKSGTSSSNSMTFIPSCHIRFECRYKLSVIGYVKSII